MPKIPEISVGNQMEKVRSGFFWPEYSRSPLEVVLTFWSEFWDQILKEFKMKSAISICWPGLIGKCHSIFLRASHWFLTGQFGILESTHSVWSGKQYPQEIKPGDTEKYELIRK